MIAGLRAARIRAGRSCRAQGTSPNMGPVHSATWAWLFQFLRASSARATVAEETWAFGLGAMREVAPGPEIRAAA